MQAPSPTELPEWTFTYPEGHRKLSDMDVYEIRWRNFRSLAGHRGGISDAARKLEKTQGQVSHFGGAKPIKNIGHDIAREIEAAYGKGHGWLDQIHEDVHAGNETTNKQTQESGRASHLEQSDAPMLAEAEKWVRFEEGAGVLFQPMRRAERLIALFRAVVADGGSLSPEHAEELITAARARLVEAAGEIADGRSKAQRGGS